MGIKVTVDVIKKFNKAAVGSQGSCYGNPSHNDLSNENERAHNQTHPELAHKNVYLAIDPSTGKLESVEPGKKIFYAREIEYAKMMWGDGLDARNAMYKDKGKKNAIKTIEQYRSENVQELLFQIGNGEQRGNEINDDDVQRIIMAQVEALRKSNSNARLDIISVAIHYDETSVHAHVRIATSVMDKNGHWKSETAGCLKSFGNEPVPFEEAEKVYEDVAEFADLSAEEKRRMAWLSVKYKESAPMHMNDALDAKEMDNLRNLWNRYHNPKETWTANVRRDFQELVEHELGIDVDRNVDPKNKNQKKISTDAWKAEQLAKKNQELTQQLSEKDKELSAAQESLKNAQEALLEKNDEIEFTESRLTGLNAQVNNTENALKNAQKRLKDEMDGIAQAQLKRREIDEYLAAMADQFTTMRTRDGKLSDKQKKFLEYNALPYLDEYLTKAKMGEVGFEFDKFEDGSKMDVITNESMASAAAMMELIHTDPMMEAYAKQKFIDLVTNKAFDSYVAGNKKPMFAVWNEVCSVIKAAKPRMFAQLFKTAISSFVEAVKEASESYER